MLKTRIHRKKERRYEDSKKRVWLGWWIGGCLVEILMSMDFPRGIPYDVSFLHSTAMKLYGSGCSDLKTFEEIKTSTCLDKDTLRPPSAASITSSTLPTPPHPSSPLRANENPVSYMLSMQNFRLAHRIFIALRIVTRVSSRLLPSQGHHIKRPSKIHVTSSELPPRYR